MAVNLHVLLATHSSVSQRPNTTIQREAKHGSQQGAEASSMTAFSPTFHRTARAVTAAAFFAAMVVTFGFLTAPADAAFSRKVRISCTADAKRLCPTSKLGSPEMEYCMEAKGKYLSRECKRALEDDGVIPRGYFNR
jgi:hypothetical protein